MNRFLPILVLVMLAMSSLSPAMAQTAGETQLVDRIVAIVDEEAILMSDLEREMELYRMEREYAGQPIDQKPEEIRSEMLNRLVESKLIIAAAKQADMTVDAEAIKASVEQKIDQFVEHFGSMENLQSELARSGMTLGDYRARMTSQLMDQQYLRLVVGKYIRPDVEVLENEIRQYYLDNLDQMPAEPDSVTIANILIPVQPSVDVRQAVQARVTEVQAALAKGTPFADVARQLSMGPNAARGGAIGTLAPGDLFDPNLDRAAFALAAGQVSEPVVSTRGVHLLRVDAVQPDGRRAISQIFFPIEITEADMNAAKARMDQARNRVLQGESFALVAAEVSGDPVSARAGGVLGTFRLEDLSAQFQEVLEPANIGEITEPVLTPAGWYVFLVQDRRDGHRYTFEELKEDLRQVVEGQKIEAALAEYVAGLRNRFFIDEKS
jgi:peptidyl-prolyl cis-trans isomerase SurA|nr:peptidylprolyl isomerase [Candidatus Krumholzibacteria bacterium]